MRTIICHYHIYKNSGTSFDALLTQNFGSYHISFDGPFPFFTIDQEQFTRVIERKRDVIAFSSHQIQLPVPVSLDFLVLPIVFLRHPLLRIQSIYKFKRQTCDGTLTSKNAQEKSFDEWISACFADLSEIAHISNGQTRLLCAAYRQRSLMRRVSYGIEFDVHQAVRNIENVQLLARTEYFNEDVRCFTKILQQVDIDFKFLEIKPQNITSKNHHMSINERLKQVKQSLSKENYQKLLDANAQDIYLYDYASRLIEYTKKKSGLLAHIGGKK
jgi:hypothetical protein